MHHICDLSVVRSCGVIVEISGQIGQLSWLYTFVTHCEKFGTFPQGEIFISCFCHARDCVHQIYTLSGTLSIH